MALTGLCECGCGRATTVATGTCRSEGRVKGQPMRFVHGHNRRNGLKWTVTDAGCWQWAGSLYPNGYGRVRVYADHGRGRNVKAHRVVYEQYVGPIPDGMQLDHLCRNPACVNPDHLEPVTPAENVRRRPASKLNYAAVAEIRRSAESLRTLAARFDVHPSTIRLVRTNKTWIVSDDEKVPS